jgi:hypothetical protein
MRAPKTRMTEDAARFWEFVAKIAGAVTILGAALLSYGQYVDTADRESSKPLLTRRLELCVELADAAGTMATAAHQKGDDVARATATFHRLMWGSLAIFDTEGVYRAMAAFDKAPEKDKEKAERVAHECRDMLARSWSGKGFWKRLLGW